MAALWSHLKPAPYNHTHSLTTMRILGKMGGRNRRVLHDQVPLSCNPGPKMSALHISIYLDTSNTGKVLDLLEPLRLSFTLIKDHELTKELHMHAFKFTRACIPLLFDFGNLDLFHQGCAAMISKFKVAILDSMRVEVTDKISPFIDPSRITRNQTNALDNSLGMLIKVLMASLLVPCLASEAWEIMEQLCQYFAILSIEETVEIIEQPAGTTNDLLKLHALSRLNGFLEAIVKGISSDSGASREIAEKVLKCFHQSFLPLIGSEKLIDQIPAFKVIASLFCSSCYQSDWFYKIGGCAGISIIAFKLNFGKKWMLENEMEFVKVIFYQFRH